MLPVVYLGLVIWFQPADHLGPPDSTPLLGRLLYDDYDMTAMALRGLNARQGRLAGRLDDPMKEYSQDPSGNRWDKFDKAIDNPPPVHDRYFLEYPQPALWLFRLGYELQPGTPDGELSPAILDAGHNTIVEHQPRNEPDADCGGSSAWSSRLTRH